MMRYVIAFAALLALLAGCGASMNHDGMEGMDGTSMPMDGSMMDGTSMPMDGMPGMDHGNMDHSTPMTLTDVEFIDGMIIHHEGAIVMATEALTMAEVPEVRELAERIVAAQGPEVAELTAWRNEWYPDAPPTPEDFMAGMDMGTMTVPPGAGSYDVRFLGSMISHHRGAIAMAEAIKETTDKPELIAFADRVIADQTAEIELMESWLAAWR